MLHNLHGRGVPWGGWGMGRGVRRTDGHYTTLVDMKAIEILEEPHLVSLNVRDARYRKAQHLVVQPRESVPIVLYNVHCPSSKKHPYHTQAREQVVHWVLNEAASGKNIQTPHLRQQCFTTCFPVYVGGDLNFSEMSWEEYTRGEIQALRWKLLYGENHKHGDIVYYSGLVKRSGLGEGREGEQEWRGKQCCSTC